MKNRKSFEEFFTHVKKLNFEPSAVIDVGAADGTPVLYDFFPKSKHFAFEPLKEFQSILAERTKHIDCKIFQYGLMDKPGKAGLFRHDDPYGSTFMCDVDDERIEEVQITTLDLALKDYQIGNQVLLKTDCQGADLYAVRGGLSVLKQCELVIMEASLYPFWGSHEPIFDEIVREMCGYGFKVYDLLDGLSRPFDGALGQVDIVFAREQGIIRSSNKW
jgi:FkbM family methyltransferase